MSGTPHAARWSSRFHQTRWRRIIPSGIDFMNGHTCLHRRRPVMFLCAGSRSPARELIAMIGIGFGAVAALATRGGSREPRVR